MRAMQVAVAAMVLCTAADRVEASFIVGLGNPATAVSGGTTINFSSVSQNSYASLTIGDVTFTGNSGAVRVSSGQPFNTSGQYLDNNTSPQSTSLAFEFSTSVDAFAFNFGAVNLSWTLTAYNSSNQVIESHLIAAYSNAASNAGEYFGISAPGIARATLSTAGSDWVLIDNFTYHEQAAVTTTPEPTSLALAGFAGIGMAAGAWRRRRQQKQQAA